MFKLVVIFALAVAIFVEGMEEKNKGCGSGSNYYQQGWTGGINIQGGVFKKEIIDIQHNNGGQNGHDNNQFGADSGQDGQHSGSHSGLNQHHGDSHAGIQENKTGSGSHYYQHGNIGGINYQNVVIKEKVIGTQHNGGVGQGEYAGSQPIYGNNHFDSQGSHDGQQSFSYGEFDQHYGVVNEHVAQKGSGANYHQHNNNGGINIQGVEFQHQIIGTQNNAGVGQGDHGGSQYGHGYNQFVTQGSHYGHQGDTHDGVINGHGPHDPQKVSEENYHQHSNNGGVNIHDSHFQHQTIGTQNNAGVGQGDHGGSQYGHGYNQFVTQGSQFDQQGASHGGFDQNHGSIPGAMNGHDSHDPQKGSEATYIQQGNSGGINIQRGVFEQEIIGVQNNGPVGQGEIVGGQ